MVIVLMGVTGCGKTTVGRLLARRLGWAFHDGDDYHPDANVRKMASGVPLADADRRPWLARLATVIDEALASGQSAVMACSALKASYRRMLAREGVRFVHLRVTPKEAERRIAGRSGHFMPASLVASQFADLEPPDDALTVDAERPPEEIVDRIVAELGIDPRGATG